MSPEKSFETIALCLSGGGYRAAAFHFGAIDMLRELNLLDKVKMISTVSGGTIVGAFFALNRIEQTSYDDYYKNFYKFLRNVNAVDDALLNLYEESGSRSLSIIRAAAEVYNTHLFHDKLFAKAVEGTANGKFFDEIIFNTTEFRIGQSFRFRASSKTDYKLGSGDYRISKEVAAKARIADIVAASSCFPSVFEPIRFPYDFKWQESLSKIRGELKSGFVDKNGNFKKDKDGNPINVPLMDGGIFDNQGIDSMLVADRTEIDDQVIYKADLFVVSDSTPSDKVIFELPTKKRKGWFSLQMLWYLLIALFISSIISSVGLLKFISDFFSSGRNWWNEFGYFFFVLLLPLVLMILVAVGLFFVIKYKTEYNTLEMQGEKFQLWESIKNLTINDAIGLGLSRIGSLIVLSANVFLRRIRLMLSTSLRSNPDVNKRVAFNYIYDLEENRPALWKIDKDLIPTDEMLEISKSASAYPTNLWFANEKALRNVLVCGQISICYSILKHLIEERKTIPNDENSPYYELYQQVKVKWLELKENPLKYYKQIS
jgi:predicted acylesterase/phospholipase RssA